MHSLAAAGGALGVRVVTFKQHPTGTQDDYAETDEPGAILDNARRAFTSGEPWFKGPRTGVAGAASERLAAIGREGQPEHVVHVEMSLYQAAQAGLSPQPGLLREF